MKLYEGMFLVEAGRAGRPVLLKRGMNDAVTTAMARELDLFNERLAAPEVAEAIGHFFTKR